MRLVVMFGEKKRYSDQECQAIYQELVEAGLDDEARRDPDAIEAVFTVSHRDDEAVKAAKRAYKEPQGSGDLVAVSPSFGRCAPC
jgi:hypothetical protein